ncbi:hypothetical protein FQR65_LT06648 [Abscondita terminalis]|nr:hypothetical protein FQR65_LT06648 [Abscondita terminalis]
MGRKCYVRDCLSEEGRYEDRGVTFHKIPLHSDIRPKWLTLCQIPEDKHNCKVIHVCSRHFLKVDFCQFKGKKYMLRQGVLPSVFPWSKLKKESAADVGINIKKEMDTTVKTTKPENEGCENILSEIKTEIKEEIKDFTNELAEEKPERPIALEDPNGVAQPEIKLPQQLIPKEKSSTTIEQKGKSIQTPLGLLNFAVNTQLEALDFNQMWFPAHIVEIDYEENEVLIHFEKYSSKYDEWISMNSSRLRPVQPLPKKVFNMDSFIEGEKVMASWNDSRKFPATVTKVIDNETYEVVFNDGFIKILKGHRISKAHGRVGSAPLFDPVTGSKQDRREKKRKLNVAQLFRKRMKMENVEDSPSPSLNEFNSSGNEDVDGWMPKWENGRPVGVESVIEASDGVRKSIIVPDPRLPSTWVKHLSQRISGASAGKWDSVIVSPEGRRFRTRAEVKVYLEENPHLNLNDSMFDFSVHRRSRGRRLTQNIDTPQQPEPMVTEEPAEVENPNCLKILLVDDAYKCPIEGCEKSFRRENLAQMHVKHYHPKFTKYLDSTPNVADLAYARTVGESLDKSPDRGAKLITTRLLPKVVTPKTSTPRPLSSPPIESETMQDLPSTSAPKAKDSEILKLLNNKSEEEPTKYPPGLPPNMYPPIKLKDLLNKSEGIPKRDDLNLKSLSSGTTRQTGIKTLLPVVRTTEPKKDKSEEMTIDHDPWSKSSSVPKSFKHGFKRKRFVSDNSDTSKPPERFEPDALIPLLQESQPQPETNPNYIVEGGEVIKIVRMKREEIINCTCGITEEDGLMIQCELCLCWQHAYCNNIERENQVPEKYICYICQNPMRQRSSRKYFHDQDWLKNGTLPVGNYHCKDVEALKKRFDTLKKSHDLSGLLVELADYMHTLKVKLKIAETKNHPKLYLWSKPWEKVPLPEKIEVKKECDTQNDPSLYSILKTEKPDEKIKDELTSLSKIDFNTLMDNNLAQLPTSAPIIPQPEEAINSTDCRVNILDHIAHSQTLVEERLNDIEAQVEALDSISNTTDEDFSRTCQTVQLLLRDLGTLQEFSQNNSL